MIQFTFPIDDVPERAELERIGRDRLARLEAAYGPFGTCEATIAGWRRGNAPGRVFHVHLAIRMGDRRHCIASICMQDDPRHAMEGALAAIERQLTQLAMASTQRSGHVVELLPEHGFGVIVTDGGFQVPVHCHGMDDRTFARLHVGDRVWFVLENDKGKPGARIVHVARFPRRSAGQISTATEWPAIA